MKVCLRRFIFRSVAFSICLFCMIALIGVCVYGGKGTNIAGASCQTYVQNLDENADSLEFSNLSENASAFGVAREVREITMFEIDPILYCYLMFLRDGAYPDPNAEEYVKLKTNDFVDRVSLDLSDIRDGDYRVTDMSGLGLFDLPNLKELDLCKNKLTSIPSVTFAGITALDKLDVQGNCLTKLEIGTLESVGILLAQNDDDSEGGNELTEVDLSKLASGGTANLAFNNIRDITKLKLKTDGAGAHVDLYGNYISNMRAVNFVNYDMIVGFQKQISEYNEKSIITFYAFEGQDFHLACVNPNTLAKTVIETSGTLKPAKYSVYLEDDGGYLYPKIDIVVKKSAPTFVVLDTDGNDVDIGNRIKKSVDVTFDSNDEDYAVEYSINGSSFVKGNSVRLEKSGTYSFTLRAVSNSGDTSQAYSFTIELSKVNNSFFKTFALIVSMFAIFGLVALGFWLVNNRDMFKKLRRTTKKNKEE